MIQETMIQETVASWFLIFILIEFLILQKKRVSTC